MRRIKTTAMTIRPYLRTRRCGSSRLNRCWSKKGLSIGPHPHNGLHTVTWLLQGDLVHHDSLGSEQPVRPGELNLMTAGHGIAHSEETPDAYRDGFHGIQLWVAQPEHTRHGPAAFEHRAELPQVEIGSAVATVLLGDFAGVSANRR